jgi:NADPH:quinone reductase
MQAIVVPRHGGPDVLEVRDVPAPQPGPGDVLVDVEAAGVNYRDIYEREGGYQREAPCVAGIEGAGTVAAVGDGVTDFAPGDRVAWVAGPGSYAEQVVVDAQRAVPVPGGVSTELAAAVLLQGMTAHYLAVTIHPVQEGDYVLVHAAAGGVGLLLTRIVALRGGRAIATTSTEEKARLATQAGAHEAIGYDGFGERVREITGGEGVAAVYDGVGAATFDQSLASLRPRGMMVLYGAASGPVPSVETQRLAQGSLLFTRPTLVHYVASREELLARSGDLFGWIADGRLDVRIGGRYPLADARRAQEDLQSRGTTGKLVLLPGQR